jgi:hypothetical protein
VRRSRHQKSRAARHCGGQPKLKNANETLWAIEDDIREFERRQHFDPQFVELSRAIYQTNDSPFRDQAPDQFAVGLQRYRGKIVSR